MKTLSTPCVEISFNKSTIFLLSFLIFTISLVNVVTDGNMNNRDN